MQAIKKHNNTHTHTVKLQFETEVGSASDYMDDYDLVLAGDGLNSKTRTEFADVFNPDIDVRRCHFVWLGTKQKFDDAFTFIFEKQVRTLLRHSSMHTNLIDSR